MKNNLRETILSAFERMISIQEEEASLRPGYGKWSIKEIIGHLIDSAANNHARFMKAQLKDDLIFEGYDQEAWVEKQNYNAINWHDLLILWRQYNLHLDFMIKQIPEAVLTQPRTKHSLNKIAWKTVPADQPTTLEYFINDYIGHLKHHIGRIEEILSMDDTE